MKSAEFKKRLEELYKEHPMIARSKKKTVNELFYILRMDKEYDYNISMPPTGDEMGWTCIPSVKECFIPVRDLAKHVKEVVCDDEDYGFNGFSLTVYTEE